MNNKVTCNLCNHELPLRQSVKALAEKNGKWVYFHARCFFEVSNKRIAEALSKQDGDENIEQV